MRFMMLYKPGREVSAPPSREHLEEMGRLTEEQVAAGVLLSSEGLRSSAMGARVRIEGGNFTVIDGPFAETTEVIAGYAIVQVASKEEAIEQAKLFLTLVGSGESEIRQMVEPADARCVELAPRSAVAAGRWS